MVGEPKKAQEICGVPHTASPQVKLTNSSLAFANRFDHDMVAECLDLLEDDEDDEHEMLDASEAEFWKMLTRTMMTILRGRRAKTPEEKEEIGELEERADGVLKKA